MMLVGRMSNCPSLHRLPLLVEETCCKSSSPVSLGLLDQTSDEKCFGLDLFSKELLAVVRLFVHMSCESQDFAV